MAWLGRTVEEALDRWVARGLLDAEKADVLRAEARQARAGFTRRVGQGVLAALGGFALVAAAVIFGGASWEDLSRGARAAVLVGAGTGVYGFGLVLAHRTALRITAILLQAAGLAVVLAGVGYSNSAWPTGTAGALTLGILTLAVPLALLKTSVDQGPAMTGVHTALSFLYLALGLERTLGLEGDTVIWVLDGVLLALLGVLWVTARSWSPENRNRGLTALGVSFWAGLVLAIATGAGPLDLAFSEDALYPVGLWALVMTGVNLWGIHGAPPEFRRDGFQLNLAGLVVVLGVLAAFIAAEPWDLDGEGAAGGAVLVGLLALTYGLRQDTPAVLVTGGCMALLGTWIFSLESAGALGGAGALLLSAVVLFWISGRVREERTRGAANTDPGTHPGDTAPPSE